VNALHVELSPADITGEQRVALQQEQLVELAHVFTSADQVRIYADKVRNFAFARDPKSLHFMADARREVARSGPHAPPPYDNLMCFFKSEAPLGWIDAAHRQVEPSGALHPAARCELTEFLTLNPQGCVFSFQMTRDRSAVSVYPGALAQNQVRAASK